MKAKRYTVGRRRHSENWWLSFFFVPIRGKNPTSVPEEARWFKTKKAAQMALSRVRRKLWHEKRHWMIYSKTDMDGFVAALKEQDKHKA